MTPKPPDRWERIVDKVLERDGRFSHYGVTDLLRKEHAWVRRMVRAYGQRRLYEGRALVIEGEDPFTSDRKREAALEILDQLKRRAQ